MTDYLSLMERPAEQAAFDELCDRVIAGGQLPGLGELLLSVPFTKGRRSGSMSSTEQGACGGRALDKSFFLQYRPARNAPLDSPSALKKGRLRRGVVTAGRSLRWIRC